MQVPPFSVNFSQYTRFLPGGEARPFPCALGAGVVSWPCHPIRQKEDFSHEAHLFGPPIGPVPSPGLGRLRRPNFRSGNHRKGPGGPAGLERAGPSPVLEHRRPLPGGFGVLRPGQPGSGIPGPVPGGRGRAGRAHDPPPLLAGDLRPGGSGRRHRHGHRGADQPGHGPHPGPVSPDRPGGCPGQRLPLPGPAAHPGGTAPTVPPNPHRPAEPGRFGHENHHRGRLPDLGERPVENHPGRGPAGRPVRRAALPGGAPSPRSWTPRDPGFPPRRSSPLPWGGSFFLPNGARRRVCGTPRRQGTARVSSCSCCGCSWRRRAPLPPSPAGCWEGRTPPQGSGSGGRSRRDPRPRPRPRRRTPGWACSSRTWG